MCIYTYICIEPCYYLQRSGHCNGDSRSVSIESSSSILEFASLVLSASSSSVSVIELVSAHWRKERKNYNNCMALLLAGLPVKDIFTSASLFLILYSLWFEKVFSINI